MMLRKLATPAGRAHTFPDLDPMLPATMGTPPSPSLANSRTSAFFASPFPARSITPSSTVRADLSGGISPKRTPPTRSLTTDFFAGASATPSTPPPARPTMDRALTLNMPFVSPNVSPSTVLSPTPTPGTSKSYQDWAGEPTPRPPALNVKAVSQHVDLVDTLASPLQHPHPSPHHTPEPLPGSQEDAEILPSSSSITSGSDHDDEETYNLAPGMTIHSIIPDISRSPSRARPPVQDSVMPSSSSSSSLFPPSDSNHSIGESSGQVTLLLSRRLGSGAFSNVWLAEDLSPTSLLLKTKKSLRTLKRKSIRREGRDKNGKLKERKETSRLMKTLSGGISGTKPYSSPKHTFSRLGLGVPQDHNVEHNRLSSGSSQHSVYLDEHDGEGDQGASLSRNSSLSWRSEPDSSETTLSRSGSARSRSGKSKLVAVKFTLRGSIENGGPRPTPEEEQERDRLRVSFVREVEVLKHISHPNITPLLSHLTTRTHHLLVLPYSPGGDLLGLIGSKVWETLTENVVRRIWRELCRAVAWMHGVGLVHRDIKLENILLTESLLQPLPISPAPLIQLTDFGLSRFIDPANPMLTTRCGSEACAAPELVIASGRKSVATGPSLWGEYDAMADGGYDARETDAWSCGVALYELVTRQLPFGDGPGGRMGYAQRQAGASKERRQWLIKIARAAWSWPVGEGENALMQSGGVQRMVNRLLVRNPSRRSRIVDLFDDEWLKDEESAFDDKLSDVAGDSVGMRVNVWRASQAFEDVPDDDEEVLENEIYEDGWIVDGDAISNIARQEVM